MSNPVQQVESKWRSFLKWLNPAHVYAWLVSLEAKAPTYTAWQINPIGTAYHLWAGAVLGYLHRAAGMPAGYAEWTSFWCAFGHEWGDGDLFTSPGHPYNGAFDILSMMVGTTVSYL